MTKREGANVSRRRLRNRKCSASRLPPIATFSQRFKDMGKSSESTRLQHRANGKRYANRRVFYCKWPDCPRALNRIPFSHRCRLKCHMLGHLNKKPYKCSYCEGAFTTALNLKRHLTIHQGSKPYKCNVCSREFARSSEWSRCRKHHRLKEEMAKAANEVCHRVPSGSTELPILGVVSAVSDATHHPSTNGVSYTTQRLNPNRIVCKPYKCPVCGETRAYADPSSLRKHMRLYHPDYKSNKVNANAEKLSTVTKDQLANVSVSGPPVTVTTVTLTAPTLIQIVTTEAVSNVVANPDASVVNLPYYCTEPQIVHPVWIRGPQDSSLNLTMEPNREADTTVPNADTISYPLPIPLLTLERSMIMQEPATQLRHLDITSLNLTSNTEVSNEPMRFNEENPGGERDDDDDDAHRWNSPVDLCNSAMCLQAISDKITDFPMYTLSMEKSSQPDSDSTELVAFLNDSSMIDQSVALDLTDPSPYDALPNEVIDLSGDAPFSLTPLNPIDLSAPHLPKKEKSSIAFQPSVNSSSNGTAFRPNHSLVSWDPEPGFSFTDLLTNNDLDDPDTIFNYLLSNDLSAHPSPCKGVNSISSSSVPSSDSTVVVPSTTLIPTQPPLDLRLPHAPLSPP